jgi:hypothetical protein
VCVGHVGLCEGYLWAIQGCWNGTGGPCGVVGGLYVGHTGGKVVNKDNDRLQKGRGLITKCAGV